MNDQTYNFIKTALAADATVTSVERHSILEYCKNPLRVNTPPTRPVRLLPLKEVVERWHVDIRTIWRYMDSDKLPYKMVGGSRRILESVVEEFENRKYAPKISRRKSTIEPEKELKAG